MSRANSLKKAIRQIIEHTEQAVDEQNGLHLHNSPPPRRHIPTVHIEAEKDRHSPTKEEKELHNNGFREALGATALTPPSVCKLAPPNIEVLLTEDDDEDLALSAPEVSPIMLSPPVTAIASLSTMTSLTVPSFSSFYSSDGESSTCSTPGSLSPVPGASPQMKRRESIQPPPSPRPHASRRLSFMSTLAKSALPLKREKSPTRDLQFPLVGPTLIPLLSSE